MNRVVRREDSRELCRSLFFVAVLLASTAGESASQITVPSDFVAEAHAVVERPTGLALAPPGSAFGLALFVSAFGETAADDDLVLAVTDDGAVSMFTTLLPEADPVALGFPPPDSPFESALYVSSNNRDNGLLGDCGGTLQLVDLQGDVSDFTSLTSSRPCSGGFQTALGEPGDFAFGSGGAFGWDLFVANSSDYPSDIVRVDLSGTTGDLVNDHKFSPTAMEGLAPFAAELGPGSEFGTGLYFTDGGEGCNCIRIAQTNGSFTAPFVTFADFPKALAFAPGGPFGRDLFVAVDSVNSDSILRVRADGTFSTFAAGFGALSIDSLEFSRDGRILYVADYSGNIVYRIHRSSPTLVLSVNGETSPSRVVTTGSPVRATLDMYPGSSGDPLSWFYAIAVGGRLFWLTPTGLSTVPGPLTTAPAALLDDITIFDAPLSAGTVITFVFFLADDSHVVALDYVTAVVSQQ